MEMEWYSGLQNRSSGDLPAAQHCTNPAVTKAERGNIVAVGHHEGLGRVEQAHSLVVRDVVADFTLRLAGFAGRLQDGCVIGEVAAIIDIGRASCRERV